MKEEAIPPKIEPLNFQEESLSCIEEMSLKRDPSEISQQPMIDEDIQMKEEAEVDQKLDLSQFIGQGDVDPDKWMAMQDYLDRSHNRKTPRRNPTCSKSKLYYQNRSTASKTPKKRVYEESEEEIHLRPISDPPLSQEDSLILLEEAPQPLPLEPLRRDFSEIYNDLDRDLLKEGNSQRI